MGSLTNWSAYTGNNGITNGGNGPNAIKVRYDIASPAPSGTLGAQTIPEYSRSDIGIQVNTTQGSDPFGFFPIIPSINGYNYVYSTTLGSTNISTGGGGSNGGYIRGVSYKINVPTSVVVQPYTITYAYAMVLENGSHSSSEQPQFSATLATNTGIIKCASPQYLLPTLGNTNGRGGGATLDSTAAYAQGFTPSSVPTPNSTNGNNNESQFRVWTKGWTEVTLDLSPYRGQQVTLTFEADNCVPGGHFSYSYIALRNVCAGLTISGDATVCSNSTQIYSVPSLAQGTYYWTIPNGWTYISGQNTNIITVRVNNNGGRVMEHELNSCANLYDTLDVKVILSGVGGNVNGNTSVCTGINSQTLTLSGNVGMVAKWISSTNNGITYTDIANTTNSNVANNLTATTLYRAVVQTNSVCPTDTSNGAIIIVDEKSIGGTLSPSNVNICAMQTVDYPITIKNNTGTVINWQSSPIGSNSWADFVPIYTSQTYQVGGALTIPTRYRSIVKNGVCPADTSSIATTTFFATPFPQSTFHPADTTICFNTQVQLGATVAIGTNYSWNSTQPLSGQGNGNIGSLPVILTVIAMPKVNADYVLAIQNTGCPNSLFDTFHIKLLPQIIVFAGNDTSIVLNQPLVFQSSASSLSTIYSWTPSTGLNSTTILQPTATITKGLLDGSPTIRYILTASTPQGCSASDTIVVRIFKTLPSIFMPSAFTPNGDGKNDIIRPILAGIESLTYFRVYNRYGQLLFQSQGEDQGWDGRINGQLQSTGTFVYSAQAVDYNHQVLKQGGTFVLIR